MTAQPEPPKAKAAQGLEFGFSTLGCPTLGPAEVSTLAASNGIPAVEIRALGGSLDFVRQLAHEPGGAAGTRNLLGAKGVRTALVASSFLICRETETARATLIDEAIAGEALGANWLRVFGGGDWGDQLTPESAHTARAHRDWWKKLRAERGWKIDLILETHDALSGSDEIEEFFARTGGSMALLWDAHHTWKLAGENVRDTWQRLGTARAARSSQRQRDRTIRWPDLSLRRSRDREFPNPRDAFTFS